MGGCALIPRSVCFQTEFVGKTTGGFQAAHTQVRRLPVLAIWPFARLTVCRRPAMAEARRDMWFLQLCQHADRFLVHNFHSCTAPGLNAGATRARLISATIARCQGLEQDRTDLHQHF